MVILNSTLNFVFLSFDNNDKTTERNKKKNGKKMRQEHDKYDKTLETLTNSPFDNDITI